MPLVRAMIEATCGANRRLRRLEMRDLTVAEKTIADSGLLDPERPKDIFEPVEKRGLFRRGDILRKPK